MTLEVRGTLLSVGELSETSLTAPTSPKTSTSLSDTLLEIFRWQDAGQDRYGWLDLAGNGIPIFELEASNAPALRQSGQPRDWRRFTWQDPDANNRATLNISVPAAIRVELPASLQICVSFDQGIVIPDALAHVYSAGFASGVASCWVISNFLDVAQVRTIDDPDLITPQRANLVAYPSYGTTPAAFDARLNLLADSIPLETEGVIRGWNAMARAKLTQDTALNDAIRAAIFSRFNWETLGEVTSYTISYLIGYYRARSINTPAIVGEDKVSLETLKRWSSDPNSPEAEMIRRGEQALCDIFAALLELEDVPGTRDANLNVHRFLIGFNRGLINSARDVFFRAVQLGYGIGYRYGFRNGYSRGYRDGYRAGFRAGLGNFLDDVVAITGNIRDIVRDVGRVVAIFG